MPALFQLKRTRKSPNDESLKSQSLKFGEPLYFDSANPGDISLVIGDGHNTDINKLGRFTPIPPTPEGGLPFNAVYFIKEGDKYYLVDKDGNKISAVSGGGSGTAVRTLRGSLQASSWVAENGHYKQEVLLPDVQEQDYVTIDVITPMASYMETLANWKYIIKAQIGNGTITFYAYDKPVLDMQFQAQQVSSKASDILKLVEAEIGTTWTTVDNYVTQEIEVGDSVKSINGSTIDLKVDLDNYATQLTEWAKIIKIETQDNKIKVYASSATTITLPIQMYVYTLES